MSEHSDRTPSSSEDDVLEILRRHREQSQSGDPVPPEGDDDVKIAPSSPDADGDFDDTRTYDPRAPHPDTAASHFAADPGEEEPGGDAEPGIASHFSDDETVSGGEEPPAPAGKTRKRGKKETPDGGADDEYAGLSKPTRIFLKIGKAFLSMSFLAKALIYCAVVLLISAYLAYYVILLGNDMFALVTDSREVTVEVPVDATRDEVIDLLSDNGLIDSKWFFGVYLDRYASKDDGEISFISGPHTLNLDMNYSQIMSALTVVKTEREIITLTFPEGFTVQQIIDLCVRNGIGSEEGFIEAVNRYPYRHEFVKLLDENGWPEDRKYRLEGYLYPDTYEFYTDTKEYLVINKMLNAFNDKVWVDWKSTYAEIWEKEGFSLDQIVTLASIVEAEGKTPEDFEYISYVFHNRLSHASSFPCLESVATIQYARVLEGLERVPDAADLDVGFDSPYNTYTAKGLPPGAICNAGLDAILATIYPSPPLDEEEQEIDAYYFVSNHAGKIYYAKTLAQHERNKATVEKENAAAAAAREEENR